MLAPWLPNFQPAVGIALVALLAYAFDAALGDPRALERMAAHPVALIGRLIEAFERHLNHEADGPRGRFRRGVATVVMVVGLCAAVAWAISFGLRQFAHGWMVEALLASSLLAFRGLYKAVSEVAAGLDRSLDDGRRAVARIVGRDPDGLDQAGVARAAIESAAENFSDGVAAPLFWYLVLGLPGLAAYKAINTLDSMIGYRTPRHEAFGRAAARLDDAANWLPARLSGALVCVAAFFARGAEPGPAWSAMSRDARRHRSPNAGWPEAAFAGALGLALAGPRRYESETIPDAWMGDGRRDAGPDDIRRALTLYLWAGAGVAAMLVALTLV
jgi:adenosylcobinamide-phosphate synthase